MSSASNGAASVKRSRRDIVVRKPGDEERWQASSAVPAKQIAVVDERKNVMRTLPDRTEITSLLKNEVKKDLREMTRDALFSAVPPILDAGQEEQELGSSVLEQARGVAPLVTVPLPPEVPRGSTDKEKRKRYHKWFEVEFPKAMNRELEGMKHTVAGLQADVQARESAADAEDDDYHMCSDSIKQHLLLLLGARREAQVACSGLEALAAHEAAITAAVTSASAKAVTQNASSSQGARKLRPKAPPPSSSSSASSSSSSSHSLASVLTLSKDDSDGGDGLMEQVAAALSAQASQLELLAATRNLLIAQNASAAAGGEEEKAAAAAGLSSGAGSDSGSLPKTKAVADALAELDGDVFSSALPEFLVDALEATLTAEQRPPAGATEKDAAAAAAEVSGSALARESLLLQPLTRPTKGTGDEPKPQDDDNGLAAAAATTTSGSGGVAPVSSSVDATARLLKLFETLPLNGAVESPPVLLVEEAAASLGRFDDDADEDLDKSPGNGSSGSSEYSGAMAGVVESSASTLTLGYFLEKADSKALKQKRAEAAAAAAAAAVEAADASSEEEEEEDEEEEQVEAGGEKKPGAGGAGGEGDDDDAQTLLVPRPVSSSVLPGGLAYNLSLFAPRPTRALREAATTKQPDHPEFGKFMPHGWTPLDGGNGVGEALGSVVEEEKEALEDLEKEGRRLREQLQGEVAEHARTLGKLQSVREECGNLSAGLAAMRRGLVKLKAADPSAFAAATLEHQQLQLQLEEQGVSSLEGFAGGGGGAQGWADGGSGDGLGARRGGSDSVGMLGASSPGDAGSFAKGGEGTTTPSAAAAAAAAAGAAGEDLAGGGDGATASASAGGASVGVKPKLQRSVSSALDILNKNNEEEEEQDDDYDEDEDDKNEVKGYGISAMSPSASAVSLSASAAKPPTSSSSSGCCGGPPAGRKGAASNNGTGLAGAVRSAVAGVTEAAEVLSGVFGLLGNSSSADTMPASSPSLYPPRGCGGGGEDEEGRALDEDEDDEEEEEQEGYGGYGYDEYGGEEDDGGDKEDGEEEDQGTAAIAGGGEGARSGGRQGKGQQSLKRKSSSSPPPPPKRGRSNKNPNGAGGGEVDAVVGVEAGMDQGSKSGAASEEAGGGAAEAGGAKGKSASGRRKRGGV